MKRTNWVAWVSFALAAVAAFSTYAIALPPSGDPANHSIWFRGLALHYKPYAFTVGLGAGIGLAAVQLLTAFFANPGFRKDTVQQILDVLVQQCGGNPRKNRVTLFRRRIGWQVFFICFWRLRWIPWRKHKRRKLLALIRIDPFAEYLYVYVRSSDARSPRRSTAHFRVSDRGGSDCEGLAGFAWEQDFYWFPDLPELKATDRDRIYKMSMEEILRLAPQNRLRRYVDASRIRDIRQLRAIDTFARHFMGHIIHTVGAREWGVLLLDSDEHHCPFSPGEKNAGEFGRLFKAQAESLGHIMRGA